MAILCLVLYTIIDSRTENMTDVIFGGVDGAYIKSDSVSFLDPASVNTPEPTADIWPQIDQDEFGAISSSTAITSCPRPLNLRN